MARKMEHFVPDMNDCVKTIKTSNGFTVHFMDTDYRNNTEEDIARIDQAIIDIYNKIMARCAAEDAARRIG